MKETSIMIAKERRDFAANLGDGDISFNTENKPRGRTAVGAVFDRGAGNGKVGEKSCCRKILKRGVTLVLVVVECDRCVESGADTSDNFHCTGLDCGCREHTFFREDKLDCGLDHCSRWAPGAGGFRRINHRRCVVVLFKRHSCRWGGIGRSVSGKDDGWWDVILERHG